MNYWLSRTPGAAAEGPFLLSQLRTMFDHGQLTTDAMVCLEGEQDWQPLGDVLAQEAAFERSVKPRWVAAGHAAILDAPPNRPPLVRYLAWGLVGAIGLGILAFIITVPEYKITLSSQNAVIPSSWDGSVDKVKEFMQATMKDPSSVEYHGWRNSVNDPWHMTHVDFSARNGFGGMNRETWTFKFDRHTGNLVSVFNGKDFLLDLATQEIKLEPEVEMIPVTPADLLKAPKLEKTAPPEPKRSPDFIDGLEASLFARDRTMKLVQGAKDFILYNGKPGSVIGKTRLEAKGHEQLIFVQFENNGKEDEWRFTFIEAGSYPEMLREIYSPKEGDILVRP